MATVASYSQIQDPVPERKRWTVDEYLRMFEGGFLNDESERFELLNGEVFSKLGQNEPHIFSLMVTADALRMAFGAGFHVSQQIPLQLGDKDRPEPDITILKGAARSFDGRRPRPEDVALLIEIADSRLDLAQGPKVELYARYGIQEYWIIDLRRRVLEVRRGPLGEAGEWAETRIFCETESATALGAPGVSVPVTDLLPGSTEA